MDESPAGNDEEADLGPPVVELALLDEDPEEGFLAAVRRSVLRRVGAADALDFGAPMLGRFLQSMLDLIFGLLGGDASSRKGEDDV